MARSNKRLRELCRKTLYTYSVDETFTAREFTDRLKRLNRVECIYVSTNRIQWWFKSNPEVEVVTFKQPVNTYKRVEI